MNTLNTSLKMKSITITLVDRYLNIVQGLLPDRIELIPCKYEGMVNFKIPHTQLKDLLHTLQGLSIHPRNIMRWK